MKTGFINLKLPTTGMLSLGKKIMCAYGLKPNQSDELWSSETRTLENFLEVRKKVTVRVRLFPRESQPASSTRWWTVTLKTRGVFRKNKQCKITESVGTRTYTTTEGRFSVDGENMIIAGELEDDSVHGRYFSLRLMHPVPDKHGDFPEAVLYEGTLARARECGVEGGWEITHDAMIFRDQS